MTRSSLLLAAALLTACQFNFDRTLGPGQIKATLLVAGASGEEAAAGARISIENSLLHVTSDSKGVFVLRGLTAGDYTLRITYDSQHNGTIDTGLRLPVHLDSGGGNGYANSRDLGRVTLVGLGDISGAVTVGSSAFSGATVVLDTISQTSSEATGYAFHGLLSGDYTVSLVAVTDAGTASAKTHIQAHVPVHVTPKGVATANFDIAQIEEVNDQGGIGGIVRLAGTGASNDTILVSVNLPEALEPPVAPGGDYFSGSVPAGVYTVTASQGGFLTVFVPFVVVGNDTTLVPPILLPAATPDCGLGADGTTFSGGGLGDACTCAAANNSDPLDPCNLNENRPCDSDSQCLTGQFCDLQATPPSCWPCSMDQAAYCGPVAGGGPGCNVCSGSTPMCVQGVCVGCEHDIDCNAGEYCGTPEGGGPRQCLSCSMTDKNHCGAIAGGGPGCNACSGVTPSCVAGVCSHCVRDADCPTGDYCFSNGTTSLCIACPNEDANHCGATCAVCSGATPVCTSGACVQCAASEDCVAGNFCDTSNHTCVQSWALVDDQPTPQSDPGLVYDSIHNRLIQFGGAGVGNPNAVFTWSLASGTQSWTPVRVTGSVSATGSWNSGIYDPIGDRVLVVRTTGVDTLTLATDGSATWGTLQVSGAALSRSGGTVTYDSQQKRMLLFGGVDATQNATNEIWSLSLDGQATPTWTLLVAGATSGSPAPRSYAELAFDPATSTLYLRGGNDVQNAPLGDTWKISLPSTGTPTWTQISSDPQLAGITYGTLAFDSANNRLVEFGGTLNQTAVNGTWTLPLGGMLPANWSAVSLANPPPPRYAPAGVYVPGSGQNPSAFWLFGGHSSSNMNDLWRLALPTSGTPSWVHFEISFLMPSEGAGIFDSAHNRLVVYDGIGNNGQSTIFLKSYTTAGQWTSFGDGSGPTSRSSPVAAYDSDSHRLIIFGGITDGYYKDTWALNLDAAPLTWDEISAGTNDSNVPDFSAQPVGVFDSQNHQLVVYDSGSGTVSTLVLNMSNPTWQRPTVSGTAPSARREMTAVYDSTGHRMILFGGKDLQGVSNFNDTWTLTLPATGAGSPTWTQISSTGPSARYGSGMVFDTAANRVLLYGGNTGLTGTYYEDLWSLSLTGTPAWSSLCPATSVFSPGTRYDFLMLPATDGVLFLAGDVMNNQTHQSTASNAIVRLNPNEPLCTP